MDNEIINHTLTEEHYLGAKYAQENLVNWLLNLVRDWRRIHITLNEHGYRRAMRVTRYITEVTRSQPPSHLNTYRLSETPRSQNICHE